MNWFEIISTVLLVSTTVSGFKYKICDSPKGKLEYANFNGCKDPNAEVCEIQDDADLTLEAQFRVFSEVEPAQVIATFDMGGPSHSLPLVSNLCSYLDLSCPLKPGELYKIKKTFNRIPISLPKPLKAKIEIKDKASNENIICAEVQILLK